MNAEADKRILIVGTGAMACLFAARLSGAGAQVRLVGSWAAGLAAVEQDGVRLVDSGGKETRYAVQASGSWQDCRGMTLSLVLVKAWQTGQIAGQLAACLGKEGVALTLQNGLGNYETLAGKLGAERAALGATTSGATLLGPGVVRQAGEGSIWLSRHPRIGGLAGWLRQAGFSVEEDTDARSVVWGKLAVNAAINPLTALLQISNGELLERPAARALMQAAAQEAAEVAAALGIELPYPDAAGRAEAVARRTAANRSSMLQDVLRGAPTEIDAICGAIVRAGEGCGVATPVNRSLWELVNAATKGTKRVEETQGKVRRGSWDRQEVRL